jgi:hypothetical protein
LRGLRRNDVDGRVGSLVKRGLQALGKVSRGTLSFGLAGLFIVGGDVDG